ncbi:P-loop containing nucleoside triphosphate hydrolase protein [Mycena albidolilacea]|uniref:P-loop containing nucleoside triphosphate hydrolase protein n=1 Tax=Mycena albidolilacea TaxID=1033008 RepID=A0AAD7F3B4_9AGAR|nr:P-loop containing nucleoside triphosphate hydrolase protein [Mycena albidolilacea]
MSWRRSSRKSNGHPCHSQFRLDSAKLPTCGQLRTRRSNSESRHQQGTISEITKRGPLAAQIQKDQQILDRTQQVDTEAPVVKPADGKLILGLAEEVQLGHVSSSALNMYFRAMGRKYPLFFFTLFFCGLIFNKIFVALRTWQLGYWAKQYDQLPADEMNVVLSVGDSFGNELWPVSAMVAAMMVKFTAVIIYAPVFFFPSAIVGAWVGQIYIVSQLRAKRLMSTPALRLSRISIRAFGAQTKFDTESLSRIDRYTRAARNYYNLNQFILSAAFSAGLATYLVYIKHTNAGDSGSLINMAVRSINDLERIQGYISIDHEKPATEAGKPPAYWPASGDLQVEGLSARYSEDGPKVLHELSFHIKSGQRGIVGHTGSGKVTFRICSVRYDGRETSELNLDALRSTITIIPQVPELLSGSLRANLDPFGQYDDIELNYTLRAAGLFALQDEMDEGRITLDSTISTGGANLSQLRPSVTSSHTPLLLTPTGLSDYKTDSIIQNSLRQELHGDVSLITAAHRLQTIMDADKIMVLDAGRLVEFDTPKELLKIQDGKLRALVEESGDREALYAMAGADQNQLSHSINI